MTSSDLRLNQLAVDVSGSGETLARGKMQIPYCDVYVIFERETF
jgi:hypothetical protein